MLGEDTGSLLFLPLGLYVMLAAYVDAVTAEHACRDGSGYHL